MDNIAHILLAYISSANILLKSSLCQSVKHLLLVFSGQNGHHEALLTLGGRGGGGAQGDIIHPLLA